MPVPEPHAAASPPVWLPHPELRTTFCGREHPLSTPAAPIHQFRGIKYAHIPVRFRQSTLVTAYPLVTLATHHGPICPQKQTAKLTEETLFGVPPDLGLREQLHQDEFECLNLNITCPGGLSTHSRVPVMLWIHGGGDRGSGSEWFFDGGALVRKSIETSKPVIIVTINFRIGLLGFAANSLIREDNKAAGEQGTGNYGLRDQRTAMEWIHRYIAEFGGDPNNVTLFGFGSGAADIILHLLSRANEEQPPLFHRAIVQSPVFEPILPDVGSATWALSRVMSALQITSIDKLRALAVNKLVGLGQNIRAVDDGVFLRAGWQQYFNAESTANGHAKHHEHTRLRFIAERPSRGTTAVAAAHLRPPLKHTLSSSPGRSASRTRAPGTGAKSRSRSTRRPLTHAARPILCTDPGRQPLIIGDNGCDGTLWAPPIAAWTGAGVVRRLKAICQNLSKASGLLRAYDISAATPPGEVLDRVTELVGDGRVAWPTHCVAEAARAERGGRNVWRYVFDQEGPARGVPHHAADLMYLFDTVPLPESAYVSAYIDADTFDVDDEEEDMLHSSALNGNPPSPPPADGPLSAHMAAMAKLSAHEVIDKLKEASEGGSSHGVREGEGARAAMLDDGGEEWFATTVDEYTYARVRDALQERWLVFAHGEAPWREERVFVFGPEGETGERSDAIFEGRRRRAMWHEALEPLGAHLVQKCSVELSRGPAPGADRC